MEKVNIDDLKRLAAECQSEKNRPLRILHIGNIANNGYLNAKIMRRIGIEADSISPYYYHIMGCPEWEDADFEGNIEDQNRPDWRDVDLKGYQRPDWFFQGPRMSIYHALEAKFKKNLYRLFIHTFILKLAVYKSMLVIPGTYHGLRSTIHPIILCLFFLTLPIVLPLAFFPWFSHKLISRFIHKVDHIATKLSVPKKGYAYYIVRLFFFALCYTYFLPYYIYRGIRNKYGSFYKEFAAKCRYLAHKYDEPEKLFLAHEKEARILKRLMQHYDFVIAYATEGIYPLLTSNQNYACYEHGTIRDIPFEDTEMGRLVFISFKEAPAVFITNTDCVAAADKMEIDRRKQYWIPHAFDTNKVWAFHEKYAVENKPNPKQTVFFSPPRQHWKHGSKTERKGNDRLIHAIKLRKNY